MTKKSASSAHPNDPSRALSTDRSSAITKQSSGNLSKHARKLAKKKELQRAKKERDRSFRDQIAQAGRDSDPVCEEDSPQERKKKKRKKGKKSKAAPREDAQEPHPGGETDQGDLEVEGVLWNDDLVLVDRRSSKVYSATERGPDGQHICIGTWDAQGKALVPLPAAKEEEGAAAARGQEGGEGTGGQSLLGGRLTELPPAEVVHPFQATADDHCETSPEAHADLAPILRRIAEARNKAPSELVIYDPYFCSGGTQRHFAALGFPNVINRNEDFYDVVRRDAVPDHDVVVTNPPYSADHIEAALSFCHSNLARHGRPWLMLLPSYVVWKDYYRPSLNAGMRAGYEKRSASHSSAGSSRREGKVKAQAKGEGAGASGGVGVLPEPFYLTPLKRYYYYTPKALVKESEKVRMASGGKKKRLHRGPLGERTSPFLSFWYCGLGDGLQQEVVQWVRNQIRLVNRGGKGAELAGDGDDAFATSSRTFSRCQLVMSPKMLPKIFHEW